MWYRYSYKT